MKHLNYTKQAGNVLFLILIAVALFAALSYAVTQSAAPSGGSAASENAKVHAATITQYGTGVKTNILRMLIDGDDQEDLEFNYPADLGSCTNSNLDCVFHPSGGGGTYQDAPEQAMYGFGLSGVSGENETGTWVFNLEYEVPQVGTSSDTADAGNELIAILPGVTYAVCEALNKGLGFTTSQDVGTAVGEAISTWVPINEADVSAGWTAAHNQDHDYVLPGDELDITSDLAGQQAGCFENGTNNNDNKLGTYVYYQVLKAN